MSAEALKEYLSVTGILSCNVNPYLPSLSDIGCTWTDMTALVDRQELFYAKVYRRRTVYLSPEVYYLLKACRAQRPMNANAERVYTLLAEASDPIEVGDLRPLSLMDQGAYTKALDFLLENLYITALADGRYLNQNWSTFRYGTAQAWEALRPVQAKAPDPRANLTAILSRSMPEKEIELLL